MIASYCSTHDLRRRIEGLLVGAELRSTNRRDEFQVLVPGASVGIACLHRCSDVDVDVEWLRSLFPPGLVEPACIVVTPLSLDHVQSLRRVTSNRVQVVWVEELDDRLLDALDQVDPWHADPVRLLGRRLLSDGSLHGSVVKAIEHICDLTDEPSPDPPTHSVQGLARVANVPSDALRRYWRKDVPLACGPKQLLSWRLLLWAVRQRSSTKWETIANRAKLQRRTLERHSRRLVGCTLTAAARDPILVKRRFQEWIEEVAKVDPSALHTHLPRRRRDSWEHVHQRQDKSYNTPPDDEVWTPLPGSPRDLVGWMTLPDRFAQAASQRQT